jgi:hypothetical protein
LLGRGRAPDHLDRDAAAVGGVGGFEHLAHATGPDYPMDGIPFRKAGNGLVFSLICHR